MNKLTRAQATSDFARGLLDGAWIERIPMHDTWCVVIRGKLAGESTAVLVDAHAKEMREFKTVDAAFRVIEGIGFKGQRLAIL